MNGASSSSGCRPYGADEPRDVAATKIPPPTGLAADWNSKVEERPDWFTHLTRDPGAVGGCAPPASPKSAAAERRFVRRHRRRIMMTLGLLSSIVIVGLFLYEMRPPFTIGDSRQSVDDYIQARVLAQHERFEAGDFLFTQTAAGGGPSMLETLTSFQLRRGHVFATRYITYTFDTNGIITGVESDWRWWGCP